MGKSQAQLIRQKMTGVLLRHARLRAGRSQAELAAALHVPKNRYVQYEHGRGDPTLPEIELVAELCGMPLGYFFDDKAPVEDEALELAHHVAPRVQRKIIGTLLREARHNTGKSQKDCGAALGVSQRVISQYETGERDIPSSELEALASYLGVPANYFVGLAARQE